MPAPATSDEFLSLTRQSGILDQSELDAYLRARSGALPETPNALATEMVRPHDIDRDDKTHFLVMEYVEGSSLQDIVRKHGPLAVGRAANYVRQAAAGLDAAHHAGLVHRDIKPGNILVDRTGTVKILDM